MLHPLERAIPSHVWREVGREGGAAFARAGCASGGVEKLGKFVQTETARLPCQESLARARMPQTLEGGTGMSFGTRSRLSFIASKVHG